VQVPEVHALPVIRRHGPCHPERELTVSRQEGDIDDALVAALLPDPEQEGGEHLTGHVGPQQDPPVPEGVGRAVGETSPAGRAGDRRPGAARSGGHHLLERCGVGRTQGEGLDAGPLGHGDVVPQVVSQVHDPTAFCSNELVQPARSLVDALLARDQEPVTGPGQLPGGEGGPEGVVVEVHVGEEGHVGPTSTQPVETGDGTWHLPTRGQLELRLDARRARTCPVGEWGLVVDAVDGGARRRPGRPPAGRDEGLDRSLPQPPLDECHADGVVDVVLADESSDEDRVEDVDRHHLGPSGQQLVDQPRPRGAGPVTGPPVPPDQRPTGERRGPTRPDQGSTEAARNGPRPAHPALR
jgi:hypothetical protein